MSAQQQASPAELKSIATGLGIAGLAGVLIGLELLPVPGGRANLHGPLWIATLVGIIAMLAGAALALQAFGRANAHAELPADAPRWMRAAQDLIGVALFASFAVLGSWVAVGVDSQHFSGGVPSLGDRNVSLARSVFGAGALICWLATVACAVKSIRRLLRRAS